MANKIEYFDERVIAMQERKEAKQLDLALGRLPKGIKRGDVANSIPADRAAISRWSKGQRRMNHDVMKPIAKFLRDTFFTYSASRADYGTLSFKDDKRLKPDLFASIVDQQQQEHERIEKQQIAYQSMIKSDQYRTSKDERIIDNYLNEYAEEMSSELTNFFIECDYTGRDAMDIFNKVNEEIGG
ncbi:hypothetical protein [Lentilactobacillus sp. SPB1-3]|uniref:Uncharacterized protein n=1 Tax=Lentilactobacillus terminaliae TaxID=3003483 RepID=A0ACD5DDP4_9LACO|nr:hypothetical protein [Lentilactobacillus sp. SPB1-3]MCZ0978001.1 hypothetical protein [Lentilactobacillus sp. SPB1-3]